jgi:hypothetical protein
MKIFASIIAFLILALGVMPCADSGMVIDEGKAKTGFCNSSDQQEDAQQEDCSPFCHCTCCAGFSINHSLSSLVTIALFPNTPTSNFLSSEVIEVAFSIWQPPRSC